MSVNNILNIIDCETLLIMEDEDHHFMITFDNRNKQYKIYARVNYTYDYEHIKSIDTEDYYCHNYSLLRDEAKTIFNQLYNGEIEL